MANTQTKARSSPLPAVNPPDIQVENHGSIVLLVPESDAGRAWIEDNVSHDGWQPDWTTVLAEPHYVTEIVLGARRDGLTVEEGEFQLYFGEFEPPLRGRAARQ